MPPAVDGCVPVALFHCELTGPGGEYGSQTSGVRPRDLVPNPPPVIVNPWPCESDGDIPPDAADAALPGTFGAPCHGTQVLLTSSKSVQVIEFEALATDHWACRSIANETVESKPVPAAGELAGRS